MFKRLKGIIYDKWPLLLSAVVCVVLSIYAYGCEPKTKSLIDPDKKVTRAELVIEIDALAALSEIGIADLDRQDEVREMIINQALVIAQGGSVNPIGILTTLTAIFGIGAAADDVRLRRERKGRKYLES